MKVIITESQYNRAVDAYISFLLEPHEVKTSKDYPNSIFWVKNDEIIAEIENSENFWLRYDIWGDISRMFNLDHSKTEFVMKKWLEKHYNLGDLTPINDQTLDYVFLEQYSNLKVILRESQYNKAIDKFISYCLEPHEVKTNKEQGNSIFWVKDGKIIAEIMRSEDFWVHEDVWRDISRMFEFDYFETQSAIKMWLEQHYDLRGLVPWMTDINWKYRWDEILNLK